MTDEIKQPLKGKYAKLAKDLRDALEYGRTLAGDDDGGTSNFDSPSIDLPRWNKALVEEAAKEAGLSCSTWDVLGHKQYVFSVPGSGQGLMRTRTAEAMSWYLRRKGYAASVYYQMD